MYRDGRAWKLKFVWGIMGGDEVVEVKLRFSAKVAYRVRESDWPGVVKREDVDTAMP